jgi:sec-independent protein translocase protein TatC
MKASMIGGLVLALPFIFYELWAFVAPGLYKRERRWVVPVITAGTTLFLVGALFCYSVAMPKAVSFLADQSEEFKSMVTVDAAFAFSTRLLLAMGAVFELPLVVFALAKLDLVTAKFLWKKFDIAIFVIFVVAAVVTPTPDVITQSVFALPMIALYAVSILVAWLAAPRAAKPGP